MNYGLLWLCALTSVPTPMSTMEMTGPIDWNCNGSTTEVGIHRDVSFVRILIDCKIIG